MDVIFYRAGESPPPTIECLKGKRVGLTRGYWYSDSILKRKDFKFEKSSSDEANIRMLKLKRIDYFVGEMTTGIHVINTLKLNKMIKCNKNDPVGTDNVSVVCHSNNVGQRFIHSLNKSLIIKK